jgi:hypothetical protein
MIALEAMAAYAGQRILTVGTEAAWTAAVGRADNYSKAAWQRL